MKQFLIQVAAFSVIGAAVWGVSKLLRCRPVQPELRLARRSALNALAAVVVSAMALFALMVRSVLKNGPTPGIGPKIEETSDLLPQLLTVVIYGVPAAFFMIRNREGLRTAGITTRCLWQSMVIGLGLAFLTFYFQPGGFISKVSKIDRNTALALVFYAFVGFGEEFLFRGYLQTRMVAWLGGVTGWVSASVIMAIVHLPHRWLIEGQGGWQAVLSSLALIPVSLLFGFIMLRTGNIVSVGLFHTFANWVNRLQ